MSIKFDNSGFVQPSPRMDLVHGNSHQDKQKLKARLQKIIINFIGFLKHYKNKSVNKFVEKY